MKEVKVEYDESIDTSIDFVDENGIEKINKRTFNRVKRQYINNNYEGEKTIFFHKFDFHIYCRYTFLKQNEVHKNSKFQKYLTKNHYRLKREILVCYF